MRNYTLSSILLITLLLPPLVHATDCEANDHECRLKESQLAAMADAGLKPTPVTAPAKTPGLDADNPNLPPPANAEPQPFKIPQPPYTKTQEAVAPISQDPSPTPAPPPMRAPTPSHNKPPFNIFTPLPNTIKPPGGNSNPPPSTPAQPLAVQYQ